MNNERNRARDCGAASGDSDELEEGAASLDTAPFRRPRAARRFVGVVGRLTACTSVMLREGRAAGETQFSKY